MTEILTESFCERCGTRYTFESASPKGARLKGLRVVSRGLRNFVMSDDTSIDEAMAAARNETDREVTSRQLDAFHKTFNFCMSCRQYTCGNCWNEVEGRCLSCAPTVELAPSPFPNVETVGGFSFLRSDAVPDDGNGHEEPETTPVEPMAWPTSDLMREEEQAAISFETVIAEHEAAEAEPVDALARLEALESALEPETVETEPVEAVSVEPESEPEPIAAAAEPEPVVAEAEPALEAEEPAPVEMDDRAAAAAAQTADLFRRFRPGQSLDDAIAAYERTQVAADALATADVEVPAAQPEPTPIQAAPEPATHAPAPEPEPIAAAQPPPAPEPQPEAEPVAAVAPPQPEWAPAPELDRAAATARPEPEPEPLAATPEPIAAETRDDLVPQPTWQVVAPDTPAEPEWPAQPEWPPRPEWPAQPEWPSQRPAEGLAFLGRPAQPTGGIEALWAESAREVADASSVATAPDPAGRPAGGVQPCVSCGLSLSASARFCRRCGSRQG
jgi:hypothetical protein